jgi:hypothetical protein
MIGGFPVISFLLFLLILLAFLSTFVFLGIWTYKDAKERGLPAGLWTFLVVLFSKDLLGIILYLLIGRRDSRFSCPSCSEKTPVKGKFCMECGTPVDPLNIPKFSAGKKWLVAMGISFGIAICSIFGFAISAAMNVPLSSLQGVNVGATNYSVGNTWTVSAMYANDTHKRTFIVNTEEDDMLTINSSCSDGSVFVIVSLDDTVLYACNFDESNALGQELPIDAPAGSQVNLTVVFTQAKDVSFSAALS